ncbi:diguanylate cyclase (GGDEF) domain-containing protein [Modicisalibacter ilicicola DSM 19980]|uniref:Diguanylate cyclase (GGDEF) domain-containing protein n=1 Tax=Modicisalibacter ilicicola DSM 19980 TaxID=1121942 RepID=A0A1M4Z976_9GAMM|nr:EAL domain-containing protein [Halomonas ilicicola]SHF14498.1 diguanylate cyclase (GGDEF) domain-containing protein [Halomonas ilicicola DSM 19980]
MTAIPVGYNPMLVTLSYGIAIAASLVGLYLAGRVRFGQGLVKPVWLIGGAFFTVLSALIIGVSIAGLYHAAITLNLPEQDLALASGSLSPERLALMIALLAIGLVLTTLLMTIYDAHFASRNGHLATSLKKANRELKSMVSRDQLTKLPNRLLLEERLEGLLVKSNARKTQREFAVFCVDLDRFKAINDSLGHHVGDELIKKVAARLQVAIRETDMVARVGGDEFMIVTEENTGRIESVKVAQRIASSLSKGFQIGDNVVRITTSIGISLYPAHGEDKHALMTHADAAMNHAKESGRNNVQFFEPGMTLAAAKCSRLENRLRAAIESDGLSLFYQPKVSVFSGDIVGVEALLRWYDEELGNVPPDEIIPIAEDTGLILPIGEWVLRTACRQSQAWQAQGYPLLMMAVNLSAIQLNNKNFVQVVKRVLEETQFPPEYLELELTESAIMQNPDRASMILRRLRELGIALSIDDFGTGYSNLAQLKRFPIDRLKIDRSFTSGVMTDVQDAAIFRAVVAMAHSLNLEIVAEGVETLEQLAFVRDLKGQQYQGYLCSKALSPEDFQVFLDSRVRTEVEPSQT